MPEHARPGSQSGEYFPAVLFPPTSKAPGAKLLQLATVPGGGSDSLVLITNASTAVVKVSSCPAQLHGC